MQRHSSQDPIIDWRVLPVEALEAQFNPRVAVPNALEFLDARTQQSADARTRMAGEYDLRYGPTPKQTFDLHRPPRAMRLAPALIFIHGGYWRALDKSDHSFVAPAFLAAGMIVVNLNYDLCPSVTLPELTAQVLDGVQHVVENAADLGIDADRIYVMGHSAGAHAAAMAVAADWRARGLRRHPVRAAICISGIYDTEVVPLISINNEVRLTPDAARAMNALRAPPRPGPAMMISVGGDEPPAWIGQSVAYDRLCRDAGLHCHLEVVPGTHHFTVLSTAVDPGRQEHARVMDFIRAH